MPVGGSVDCTKRFVCFHSSERNFNDRELSKRDRNLHFGQSHERPVFCILPDAPECEAAASTVLIASFTSPRNLVRAVGPNGEHNGLAVLMSVWTENQKDFTGRFDVNTAMVAMTKLLQSRDPRLESVMVRGERIVTQEEASTIRTRSRAKTMVEQYTSVPTAAKFFQLLVDELASRIAVEEEVWCGWVLRLFAIRYAVHAVLLMFVNNAKGAPLLHLISAIERRTRAVWRWCMSLCRSWGTAWRGHHALPAISRT